MSTARISNRRGGAFAVVASVIASLSATAPSWAAGRCGNHDWCNTSLTPDDRASLLLAVLTQDEKITLLTGGAVARVDIPALKFTDGGVGAGGLGAGSGQATGLPAGTALAAGFDPAMALAYGAVVGNEVKGRGFDGVYGPNMNLMRTPLGGRTFEAYGEDPYLSSRMAVGWIRGAQAEGVIADAKHYAVNNQEGYLGVPPVFGLLGSRSFVDVTIDERTLRETELQAFEASVNEADVATLMCSYNKVRGVYVCENRHLLTEILKDEWGFDGFVVSDFLAAHNTIDNMNNGMDYDIASSAYNSPLVTLALASGQVSQATLDEHVHRILRTLFKFGFFDRAGYVDDVSQIDQPAHALVARTIAERGVTLLRNDGILPLDPSTVKSIAVIGGAANRYIRGSGSSQVSAFHTVTPLRGITDRAGSAISVRYNDGTLPLLAAIDAAGADVAIVVAADTETEGSDKTCMSLDCPGVGLPDAHDGANMQYTLPGQEALIRAVAAANPNTIVVLETADPVLTPWRDCVAALLEAWYPGQEGGTAIARVLFGDVDAGGRLPVTFPKRYRDTPTGDDLEKYPGIGESETYKEGVLVGYRWYDWQGIEPAYPFGYGLSYTTFSYHDLAVQPAVPGPGATVTVQVTNTGGRAGIAVPELYVGLPEPAPGVVQPPWQLKGFAHLALDPGATELVTFTLGVRDLSYWDVGSGSWVVAPGCYGIMIGSSSRMIAEESVLPIGVPACP